MRRNFWAISVLLITLLIPWTTTAQDEAEGGFPPVEQLRAVAVAEFPHDTDAFTQGLLIEDGVMYESTGRFGQSSVREVDLETGEVLRKTDLPDEFFGEGLAYVNDRLYQITWQAGIAIVYDVAPPEEDPAMFTTLGAFRYNGEGWGLCYDGERLFMSDGTTGITIRDPETFQTLGTYRVTLYGAFVDEINELECVGDEIYANIWQSDTIIRFDKTTGVVDAVIDGSGLLVPE
ncbi:MAG: glutaminyl-peptide cyclotransferase, partial [Chloroflexota bacterium]